MTNIQRNAESTHQTVVPAAKDLHFQAFRVFQQHRKNSDNITNGAPEASQSESILSLSQRSASHSRG